jgi:hypothetical protein
LKKRSVLFVVSLMMLLTVAACGRKGDPVPLAVAGPKAISNLAGEVRDGVLFLSFAAPARNEDGSPANNIEGFKIFKSCKTCYGGFEPFKDIRLDAEQGFTFYRGKIYVYDEELADGYQYAYHVFPYTSKGTRGAESNTFAITWEKTPQPPGSVFVKEDDGVVELQWAQIPGMAFNVYRFDGAVYPLFPLNGRPLATPLYMDAGLENGRKYIYEVRSVSEKGGVRREGAGRRIEAVPVDRIPPPPPHDVQAELKGVGVQITWEQKATEDILGYNIFRIVGGKREQINKEPLKDQVFFDRNLPAVRYISYMVTSLDMSKNESTPSREAVVILKRD